MRTTLAAIRSEHAVRIGVFALIGVVSAFVAVSQLRANPATTIPPDYGDLVLNLTFDNDSGSTAADSSKYQHNGTTYGTTVTDGKFGGGRSFNGTSDHIVVPHADALSPTSALTAEVWVYLETSDSMKILQKRGVFSDTAGGYMLGAWFGNPRGYGFEVYDSNQHLVNTTPERLPTTQTWTHVAATFDGSAIKLYENGQLVGTTAWSGAIIRSTKDLWIGMQPDNSLMPFKGKLDELRIYNRALSGEEITCSYEGKVWVNGSCQSTPSNRSPVVVSMSGPTTATAGVQATWTVKAHDPDTGRLTYSVDWGESGVARSTEMSASPQLTNDTQTFAHVYQTAGTFTPQVTVTDPSGSSAMLSASPVVVVVPQTTVGGSIMSSTTWTKANSPYVVTSDVTLFPGATITVEPGVEVKFNQGTRLTVRGNLIAEGTDVQRITFTSSATAPAKGAWAGIQIANQQGGKASLKFATIAYAGTGLSVECCGSGGPVTIADSTFRENQVALGGYAGWKARVDRTVFENNTRAVTQADKDIYDSTFRNNTYGLDQTERISVYRSTFTGHTIAAWGGRGDFKQNTVTNNETGIQAFFEGWKTTYNTITGNGVGMIIGQYDSTTPEIAYNNIHSNTTYDVKVTGASNKTAANNWWGTTDTSAIDQKVYDGRDSASLGLLTYQPVRVQAVDIASAIPPPAPTPTPPPPQVPPVSPPPVDTTPPGVITQFTIVGVGGRNADLSWIVPSDNVGVVRFEICYRTGTSVAAADCSSGTTIRVSSVSPPGATQTYRYDLFWAANTDYAFGIRACDAADNCSPLTTTTFRTVFIGGTASPPPAPPDSQAPGIPTQLIGESSMPTSASLSWLAPSDNVGVTSYQVRYRQGTSFANVDWASATATPAVPSTVAAGQRVSTVLYNLTAGTNYAAGVKACDAAGNCSTIAAATFRTQGTTTTTATGTGTTTTTTTTGTGTGTSTGTTTTSTGTTTTPTGTGTGTTTTTTTGTGTTTTGTSSGGGGGGTTTTTTTGTATLRVTVRDAANQPMSGAFVGLSFPGGGAASPTVTTGVDGIVVFSGIAAGSYHLGISPPATRADLGSVASRPVALAIGSTTEASIALPVRTVTTDTTTGATTTAAALCGTVYDPDRNILSGITIGLSSSGNGTALLGTSTVTGADGRYCFANLAPGTYVVGAATPSDRTYLAPPFTAVVSLAAGTTGSQDLVFGRASSVATIGVPAPPPPSVAPPLPAIERCVRDAFGLELYERMRTGRYKPKVEEYERSRHCFNLTVIADHRPIETPIGAPAIPTPSVIVIPGPAVPPPTVRPPEFDSRCEVRELPRVKRDLQRVGRELTAIEREIARLRTAKVTVPIDTGLLIARARDLLKQVQAAKTCEDAFTAGEEFPDLMAQLRTSVERVSRLRFAPRVLTSFDREVKRFLDRTRVSIRRLERSKFAIAEFRSRLAEAEQQLKDCRASAASALTAVDPELFEDTMRSCFEILDEAREIQSLADALANARAFLTGQVNATLRKAARVARDLERQKKDASEVKQFADVLKQRREEALAALRAGGLAKDELVDLMEEVITAFGDLDDAFERALGTSTYEEIVGKAPPPSIAAPKLEKPAEKFFERE